MNKDEALKCLDISKQKYRSGDAPGALKFAEKAKKLCDGTDIQQWIQFLKANPIPSAPKAKQKEKQNQETKSEEPSRPYTQDQVKGIKRILDCKNKGDLYGIFGLEKSCTDNEIKKAYRKLALQYHPDKCGAPGTDDAFKAIGHAWTVLGDEDKRSNYDRFGIDSESSQRGQNGRGFHSGFQAHGFGGQGFEGEITPEDLLRMFMGGGGFGGTPFTFNTGGHQFRTRNHNRNTRQEERATNASVILQLLPVILLFLFSIISMFTNEEDPFSFNHSHLYSMKQTTTPHGVTFYVQPSQYARRFSTPYKRQQLNEQVESDYLHRIRIRCGQEREAQAFQIRQASSWFSVDEKKLEMARNMPLPSCQEIQNWFNIK